MLLKIIPKNHQVYVSVFAGHLGAFVCAFSMTWASPILPKLGELNDNPLGRRITITEQSLLGSITVFGGLIGTFLFGHWAKKYGRRPVMIALGFPCFIAYFLLILTENIWQLYISRILAGVNVGGVLTVNTMYFGEVAEASNRGFLGTAMTCFINLGLVFVLILGPYTSFVLFHVILTIMSGLYILVAYLFVTESPYYLAGHSLEKAERNLRKLRGVDDVTTEMNEIRGSLQTVTSSQFNNFFQNSACRKGIFIGCGLILSQQLSGTGIIMTYGQMIFSETSNLIPSELGPIILTSILFVIGFVTPVFIERIGRKVLLYASYIGMTLAHISFGIYFVIKDQNSEAVQAFHWLPLASLVLYITTYSFGAGPIPWVVISEIFPMEAKSFSTSVCLVVLFISSFVPLITYNFLKELIGIGPVFWCFGFFGIVSIIFNKCCVIETKGISLKEIQNLMGD